MSTTPYMNLTLPVPTVTEGPTYAEQEVTAFEAIDAHDHTPGKGTPVPSAGVDIDDELDFQENYATNVGAVELVSQPSSLPATVVQGVYSISGDLWYNNDSGVPVQITQGSSIANASSPLVPSGVIWPYGGSSAPTGFLICDGTAVSRTGFADLFSAIGVTYGVGNGTTTFNLPNFNGRAPVGAGTYTDPVSGSISRSVGSSGGAAAHVLTVTEMPTHSHGGGNHQHFVAASGSNTSGSLDSSTTLAQIRSAGDSGDYVLGGRSSNANIGVTSASGVIVTDQGGGVSHNNMQPYLVTNFIIKT